MKRIETVKFATAFFFVFVVISLTIHGSEKREERWACAANCIDDRVQKPVKDWATANCDVSRIDVVTAPGIDKILAENKDLPVVKFLENNISTSINSHKSRIIFIAGHDKCAGNNGTKQEQIQHLREVAKRFKSYQRFKGIDIILLWVETDTGIVTKID